MASLPEPSAALSAAIEHFDPVAARGYLAAASIGLPTAETVEAMRADLEAWRTANRDPMGYEDSVEASRGHFARLARVPVERVAIGSQTSVMASLFAGAVPPGAEVLCIEGDFTSVVYPFLQRPDITVRSVPLDELAASITDATWLVAFSLIQSSNGRVADVAAIRAAAAAHGSRTVCDVTQAAGVHPFDGRDFDATVCHAYKWLCAPRGVAFLTISEEFADQVTPLHAGWYAGEQIWQSIYGPQMTLAASARRFDVSPAWPCWPGAEPALRMFAGIDIAEVWARTSGLGDLLCDALEIPQQHQAIVTWPDSDGDALARLSEAGIKVSGRAGRLRAAFHLWNDESDVDAVARVLAL
ncbi:aminotransferase class V-fold PLP-dependent enzyme [Salinibacterium sp. SYSU T00001]|uniref:aminotransferase class V-fold PLP-dependent enzyme n=1 Tax=Homoserinimonas sedimenticola TaxID=2986805 RepID=UPI0022366FB0|nr:aminotransferase class V-fold PLP-dependent enzyme [Salinibacterium sedimenticola]MCW4384574.1 aminotransferase class V-fold PLP-dependent enzyme [Salinibacterium sedimenticola]